MSHSSMEPAEYEPYEFRVYHLSDFLQDSSLSDEWDTLVNDSQNINALYASSSWLAHQSKADAAPIRVWCVHHVSGPLLGGAAVMLKEFRLKFSIASRTLLQHRLMTAHILGSVPCLPESNPLVVEWIRRIFSDWPDCQAIYSDACPTHSYFFGCLQNSLRRPGELYHYCVDGPRPWHLLHLKNSFDEYLEALSPKARSAFRRKVRMASKGSLGTASFRCVTTPEDVAAFLQNAASVSQQSWQHKILGTRVACDDESVRMYMDAASRGLLRCYLLNLGTTPCAFVIGYQYCGIYHYCELGFREDLSEHSPGTVLLYYIIEDLHQNSPPFKVLNFGVGDAAYKRRYGNRTLSDVSSLVLRRNVRNKLMTVQHASLERILSATKKLIGRRVTK